MKNLSLHLTLHPLRESGGQQTNCAQEPLAAKCPNSWIQSAKLEGNEYHFSSLWYNLARDWSHKLPVSTTRPWSFHDYVTETSWHRTLCKTFSEQHYGTCKPSSSANQSQNRWNWEVTAFLKSTTRSEYLIFCAHLLFTPNLPTAPAWHHKRMICQKSMFFSNKKIGSQLMKGGIVPVFGDFTPSLETHIVLWGHR